MDFEELFDNYFTSKSELEKNLAELQNDSHYDCDFLKHSNNSENGTAFFNKFTTETDISLANPPFEVIPFKTYVLSDQPDLLRQ